MGFAAACSRFHPFPMAVFIADRRHLMYFTEQDKHSRDAGLANQMAA